MFLTPSFPGFLSLVFGRLFLLEKWRWGLILRMQYTWYCIVRVPKRWTHPLQEAILRSRWTQSPDIQNERQVEATLGSLLFFLPGAILRNADQSVVQIQISFIFSGLNLQAISFLKFNTLLYSMKWIYWGLSLVGHPRAGELWSSHLYASSFSKERA